jgi:hypothetical protein
MTEDKIIATNRYISETQQALASMNAALVRGDVLLSRNFSAVAVKTSAAALENAKLSGDEDNLQAAKSNSAYVEKLIKDIPNNVDCKVSEWTPWSGCSKNCGPGTKSRRKSILVPSKFGGNACPKELEDVQPCFDRTCPVDCKVSAWSAWTPCDKECGGGQQSQERTIVVEKAGDGLACPSLTAKRPCNVQACSATDINVNSVAPSRFAPALK